MLFFTGAGVAARGAASIAEGAATRVLAGSVGEMGFQVAGRRGFLAALSRAGESIIGQGLRAVTSGTWGVAVVTLPDRMTLAGQTLSLWD